MSSEDNSPTISQGLSFATNTKSDIFPQASTTDLSNSSKLPDILKYPDDILGDPNQIDWANIDYSSLLSTTQTQLELLHLSQIQFMSKGLSEHVSTLHAPLSRAMGEVSSLHVHLRDYVDKLKEMGKDVERVEMASRALRQQAENEKKLLELLDQMYECVVLPIKVKETVKTNSSAAQLLTAAVIVHEKEQRTLNLHPVELRSLKAIQESYQELIKYKKILLGTCSQSLQETFQRVFQAGSSDVMTKGALASLNALPGCSDKGLWQPLLTQIDLFRSLALLDPGRFTDTLTLFKDSLGQCIASGTRTLIKALIEQGPLIRKPSKYLAAIPAPTGPYAKIPVQTSGVKSSGTLNVFTRIIQENAQTIDGTGPLTGDRLVMILLTLLSRASSYSQTILEHLLQPVKETCTKTNVQKRLEALHGQIFGLHSSSSMMTPLSLLVQLVDNLVKMDPGLALDLIWIIETFVKDPKCPDILIHLVSQANVSPSSSNPQSLLLLLQKTSLTLITDQANYISRFEGMSTQKRSGLLPFIRCIPVFLEHFSTKQGGQQKLYPVTNSVIKQSIETLTRVTLKRLADFLAQGERESMVNASTAKLVAHPEEDDQATKPLLNASVMLIENLFYWMGEVQGDSIILGESLKSALIRDAQTIYQGALKIYIRLSAHRVFGSRLYEFIEDTDKVLKTNPSGITDSTLFLPLSVAKRALTSLTSKDLRKNIESLFKRAQKHFLTDELSISKQLLEIVWKSMRDELVHKVKVVIEESCPRLYQNEVNVPVFSSTELYSIFDQAMK